MPPPDADFGIEIEFQKGAGNPRRVFDALSALLDGFERLDRTALESIDSRIEASLVLEDIEAGSIRAWFRNVLKAADDDALKGLDWKPLVGQYLVKAKYAALRWLDNPDEPPVKSLSTELRSIAQETDVRHLPDYAPPSDLHLLDALERMQDGKRLLRADDRLLIEADAKVYEVDLRRDRSLPAPEAYEVIPAETVSRAEMVLTVRKPDMIGRSMWQFKHGSTNLSAPIQDADWLDRYHRRQVAVMPGDALRCLVSLSYSYDKDGRLAEQKLEIEKVLGIVPGAGAQTELEGF